MVTHALPMSIMVTRAQHFHSRTTNKVSQLIMSMERVAKKEDVFESDEEESEDAPADNHNEKQQQDEEDASEDEEEEYEPQLKYQRLVGSLPEIFSQDGGNYASALAVADKFLV